MSRPTRKQKTKTREPKPPPSRFAPKAFLSGSPDTVQQLCEELAKEAASHFVDLTGTSWANVASSIVAQLRRSGHDLSSIEDSEGLQEWHAAWHHPRGTFAFFVSFRAPASVEVTWKTEAASFTAQA